MDLNDINISDLKDKLLQIADKKTLIKFGIGFGSIILFLIIYYAILNPIVKNKKVMLDDMTLKQAEISTFNKEIIAYKARLKKIEPEIKCESALYVHKDASTDYSLCTNAIMQDSKNNNTKFLVDTKVTKIKKDDRFYKKNKKIRT